LLKGATSTIPGRGEIWFGPDCSTTTLQRDNKCTKAYTITNVNDLSRTFRPELNTREMMSPLSDSTACPKIKGSTATWVVVDTNGDSTYEYSTSKSISYDPEPPELPTDLSAKPGEGAIVVSWTNPDRSESEVIHYQFFCSFADGSRARSRSHSPRYQTAAALCGSTAADAKISFESATGAGTAPVFLGEDDIGPFICGEAVGTATSARISGLRAGMEHYVAMVAVDDAGNAAGQFLPDPITPTSVIDFWEDLHDQGSDAEGGLCLLATTFGNDSGISRGLRGFRDETLARSGTGRWLAARYYELSDAVTPWLSHWAARAAAAVALAPLVAVALLWHYLTLPGLALLVVLLLGWRLRHRLVPRLTGAALRRLGRATSAGAVLMLLVLGGARVSSAQSSVDPYWADEDATSAEDPYAVRWHAGIRVGPYTPDIDKQFGADPGPYEQMFGGYAVMPMLDVDYIFLETGLGQLGAGGSIGFMTKTAKTYQMGSTPGDGRMRTAEENSFRMIPMAATAVFRLTYLDDRFRVPIVPYVRGGLAYYFWWAEAPDGGVSSVCREGGETCDENKARGGSLGLVGSIGLAVRAEKIDFEAASAMREGGIQHAGFYAEVQAAKVNDFGIGNKLSVGDITWFAGVDFEF
jgi:hypothetical protein